MVRTLMRSMRRGKNGSRVGHFERVVPTLRPWMPTVGTRQTNLPVSLRQLPSVASHGSPTSLVALEGVRTSGNPNPCAIARCLSIQRDNQVFDSRVDRRRRLTTVSVGPAPCQTLEKHIASLFSQ